jgi:twinkle protein
VSTAVTVEEIATYASRGFADRKIRKDICEFYGVKVAYDSEGKINEHYYPYSSGGYKLRKLPKEFSWIGPKGGMGLFGQQLFQGGGKRLIITEGEIDALSMAQAVFDKYKKNYPVISIPSSTGVKELIPHREWIRSFGEVVLALDNDEPGEKATQAAIKIIGIDKIKIWKPPCKDANEVLLKHGPDILNQCIWDAQAWSPAGIIKKEDIWKQIIERRLVPSIPYPPCLEGLNTKLKGMRTGEITLFISGTGSGKSTITREIELHLLEVIPEKEIKVGIISLEESPGETGLKLAGMKLRRNPSNEEIPEEELRVGFDEVFKDDRLVVLDHQGSIKDDSIIDQLEYMCLIGCKYIIIDHITILVSEGADGLTGNEAIDKIMNDLLRLVKRHDVWIGLVSHLRKVQTGGKSFEEGRLPTMDDIRGSGSIKQVSFDVVAFARDMMAKDEHVRNTILMAVLKSRTMGLTGAVNGACYSGETARLSAVGEESFDVI